MKKIIGIILCVLIVLSNVATSFALDLPTTEKLTAVSREFESTESGQDPAFGLDGGTGDYYYNCDTENGTAKFTDYMGLIRTKDSGDLYWWDDVNGDNGLGNGYIKSTMYKSSGATLTWYSYDNNFNKFFNVKWANDGKLYANSNGVWNYICDVQGDVAEIAVYVYSAQQYYNVAVNGEMMQGDFSSSTSGCNFVWRGLYLLEGPATAELQVDNIEIGTILADSSDTGADLPEIPSTEVIESVCRDFDGDEESAGDPSFSEAAGMGSYVYDGDVTNGFDKFENYLSLIRTQDTGELYWLDNVNGSYGVGDGYVTLKMYKSDNADIMWYSFDGNFNRFFDLKWATDGKLYAKYRDTAASGTDSTWKYLCDVEGDVAEFTVYIYSESQYYHVAVNGEMVAGYLYSEASNCKSVSLMVLLLEGTTGAEIQLDYMNVGKIVESTVEPEEPPVDPDPEDPEDPKPVNPNLPTTEAWDAVCRDFDGDETSAGNPSSHQTAGTVKYVHNGSVGNGTDKFKSYLGLARSQDTAVSGIEGLYWLDNVNGSYGVGDGYITLKMYKSKDADIAWYSFDGDFNRFYDLKWAADGKLYARYRDTAASGTDSTWKYLCDVEGDVAEFTIYVYSESQYYHVAVNGEMVATFLYSEAAGCKSVSLMVLLLEGTAGSEIQLDYMNVGKIVSSPLMIAPLTVDTSKLQSEGTVDVIYTFTGTGTIPTADIYFTNHTSSGDQLLSVDKVSIADKIVYGENIATVTGTIEVDASNYINNKIKAFVWGSDLTPIYAPKCVELK